MSGSFDKIVDKKYRTQSAEEILAAPVDALLGVSGGDTELLRQAFGIDSLRDLATNPFFRRAQAVLDAAEGRIFDPGPDHAWEAFFAGAPLGDYQQHPDRFRLDFGPVYYRGRLDGTARVLVVGQDPSHNEIVGHRIFVGRSGQRVQGFLHKLGIGRSYVMINTFLYSIFGQVDQEMRGISLQEPILGYRNEFFDRLVDENPIRAIIAVGRGAEHGIESWPRAAGFHVQPITHPAARDDAALLANWNQALETLRPMIAPDDGLEADLEPYGQEWKPQDEVPIPRHDLPFGMPDWHGVGSRTSRDGNKKIAWKAP